MIKQRLREEKPTRTLTIPKGGENSQEIVVWEGNVLTANLDSVSRQGIYNAQPLKITGWGDSLELECTESAQTYSVPLGWAQANLRHGAAICYAAVQGRSCTSQRVALWDTTSKRFTRKHLVMGLSRASRFEDVWLGA